jgi:hypothetical protein
VQRIFQLNAYKLNRELVTGLPMTAEMLASEYSSKVRVSSGETVSISYAYSAISVYNQIFKDDIARALVLKAPLCIHLLWRPWFAFTHMYTCTRMHTMHAHICPIPSFWQADEEFGKKTPWDSVTKLEWVYKKAGKSAGSRRRIVWQLAFVNDALRTKTIASGELSIMALSGKGRGGGRGFLDLALLKLDVLDEFIQHQAEKCNLSSDAKSIIKEVVDNHATYRSKVGDDVDMMWMVTLPQSAKEFIGLVGDRPIHV